MWVQQKLHKLNMQLIKTRQHAPSPGAQWVRCRADARPSRLVGSPVRAAAGALHVVRVRHIATDVACKNDERRREVSCRLGRGHGKSASGVMRQMGGGRAGDM